MNDSARSRSAGGPDQVLTSIGFWWIHSDFLFYHSISPSLDQKGGHHEPRTRISRRRQSRVWSNPEAWPRGEGVPSAQAVTVYVPNVERSRPTSEVSPAPRPSARSAGVRWPAPEPSSERGEGFMENDLDRLSVRNLQTRILEETRLAYGAVALERWQNPLYNDPWTIPMGTPVSRVGATTPWRSF